MKKIYIFAAVIALLTLSLNAQMNAEKKKVVQPTTTTEKVDVPLQGPQMTLQSASFRAPKRATVTNTSTVTASRITSSNVTWTGTGGETWTVAVTGGVTNQAVTNEYAQVGSRNNPSTSVAFSTSGIEGTITSIVVDCASYNALAKLSATVGGTAFGTQNQSTPSWSNNSGGNVTFSGSASGAIAITMTNGNNGRAMYIKSITVTYETEETEDDTESLTVCDGNYYSEYLPVFGYYYDEAEHNQMVYPASLLGTAMIGKTIKKMTFYPTTGTYTNSSTGATTNYSGINFSGGSVTFKLMNLSSGTSAFEDENPTLITGTMTQVATVVPAQNTSATTWVITFNQDFVYTGGDLLIDVTTDAGNFQHSYFTVDPVDANRGAFNVSYNGTNYNYGVNFLPKVTFAYEAGSEPKHDLAIAMSAPATAGAGSTVNVNVTVTNNGDFAENGYTVTVTDGTNNVTITAQEELPVGESAEFTVQMPTSSNASGQTVNYTATVACTDDAVAGNNTATASTSLLDCPPPENVAATANNNSGTMTWDAPIIPSITGSFAWDFESQSQVNDWTIVNADNDSYNWEYFTYTSDAADVFIAHSGTSFMRSASYINNVGALYPDNWMISPEVTLGGTLTFYASGADAGEWAAEKIGVYVLEGSYSGGTANFVQVDADITTTSNWTQYTFDLSQYQGVGRFAIVHHNVSDMYFAKVDDIEYNVNIPGEQPISYNIYMNGQFMGNVDANTFSYTFNNLSDGTYNCSVSAVYSYGESVAVPTSFTIVTDQNKTPTPVINYTIDGEYVTITATGDGTVTLNVPGYEPATGDGEASITIPRGVVDIILTATATAQEDGKDESDTATRQITIPAGSDWHEMDGTYNNPNDLLSFLAGGEDIMLIDQFIASTLNNDHPDRYTYTLRQTVDGETKTSTPVSIPVYKTNSTMQGLYTKDQVDNVDMNMSLKANVVNTEMDFDADPDRNVLYYELYRGELGDYYPTIADNLRVSQLQKYEQKDENDVVHFLFKETFPKGILPHYEGIGSQVVERLDTNWVEAEYDNFLSYVPVITTFGLYTARGDGKNNTYGSDIKREYMGKVDATITGTYTAGNDFGTWKVGETEYCVFHPTITVTGILPRNNTNNVVLYNDEDEATYVLYKCRAWCTYEGIHDFTRNSDGNLQDAGVLPTPYWLGDTIFEDSNIATIGGEWTGGSLRDRWSFGLPSGTRPEDVTYIIRFYYKKVVTEGQQQSGNSTGRFIGREAEEYFIAETSGEFGDWVVGVNELYNGIVPVDVTYVNPQGMQSSRPFDGVNIVVTRYSDGSTRTTKIIR